MTQYLRWVNIFLKSSFGLKFWWLESSSRKDGEVDLPTLSNGGARLRMNFCKYTIYSNLPHKGNKVLDKEKN